MFAQPNAEYESYSIAEDGQIVAAWGPVPANLWPYFSTLSQAETLFVDKIKPLSPDAVMIDGLGLDVFIPVRYLDAETKIWVYRGSVKAGLIDEYAGTLWDRRIKPNPFVDQRGPNLVAKAILVDGQPTGIAQLSWSA